MTTPPRRATMRASVALAATLLTASTLSGCGVFGSPDLVVYNAQHEELLDEIVPLFEEESGLDVELRSGKDLEMANQIVEEGEDTPADVFLTENSPAMSAVERAGLFAELENATTAPIPERYRPASGLWTGFVARSTVLFYNPDLVTEEELPASILDLADPEYDGLVSFSPTGADFQAIVAAVLELRGEEATRAWLEGLAANGTVYDGNNVVLDMTLTSAACPLTDVITDQTNAALEGLVNDVNINWVWMPPWGPDKITDDGREMLRALGFNV